MTIDEHKKILELRRELHATLTVANMPNIYITIKNTAICRLETILKELKELGVSYTIEKREGRFHASQCKNETETNQ